MLTGAVAYPLISYLSFITPYLIFTMLFLTFCKLPPRDIHLHPAHLWLLLIQLIGCLVTYALVQIYDPIVAQGAFMCVLVPTATAAAVVTGLLGGNVAFLTTYLMLCNTAVAIVAPLLLPLVGSHPEPFINVFLLICKQVGPILICPLLLAWLIRYTLPKVNEKLISIHNLSFYLWAVALTVVTAQMVNFFMKEETHNYKVEISLAIASLIICVSQFIIGRRIGRHYGDPVSSGQGLGQKNTILAMWMSQAYLNPLSSIGPATYILWQNIINSYQLWLRNKNTPKNIK
ncbi:transporter [Bacteroidia bacterium]|nr:transporter [Bacteroidia bacterium]